MRDFWKQITRERWNLHVIAGFIIGALLLPLFTWIDQSLRWYELMILFAILGVIIGLAFELLQAYAGERYINSLRLLYKYKILSKYRTFVSIPDAIATGIGMMASVPLCYIFYFLLKLIF